MATSKEMPLESAITAMTITLASMATANCRTGTAVDNSSNRYRVVWISASVKSQGTPAANTVVELWGLRSNADSTPIPDGGYADDTAYSLVLRPRGGVFLGYLEADGSATPTVKNTVKFVDPGVKWNILIINSLGQTLDATGGNHVVSWRGENPEQQ